MFGHHLDTSCVADVMPGVAYSNVEKGGDVYMKRQTPDTEKEIAWKVAVVTLLFGSKYMAPGKFLWGWIETFDFWLTVSYFYLC